MGKSSDDGAKAAKAGLCACGICCALCIGIPLLIIIIVIIIIVVAVNSASDDVDNWASDIANSVCDNYKKKNPDDTTSSTYKASCPSGRLL